MMKLFVGNLPYSATEADLEHFFTQAGVTADSVNVMRDRFSGEARGFGFVEISSDADATRAIESLNGQVLMGRAIIVNEARPMAARQDPATSSGGSHHSANSGDDPNRW